MAIDVTRTFLMWCTIVNYGDAVRMLFNLVPFVVLSALGWK